MVKVRVVVAVCVICADSAMTTEALTAKSVRSAVECILNDGDTLICLRLLSGGALALQRQVGIDATGVVISLALALD